MRPGRGFLIVALGVWLPGLILFHVLAPRPEAPAGAAFRLAAVVAVVLLAWAPSLGRPDRVRDPRAFTRLGVLMAGAFVALAIVEIPRGRIPLAETVILTGFGATLLGLRNVLRGLRLGERGARLVPLVLGALTLTTLSWSGPVIESTRDAAAGTGVAIWANPLAAIAGGVHGLDWTRFRPITYDAFVGQYYPFAYPSALAAAFGWAFVGVVLAIAGAASLDGARDAR